MKKIIFILIAVTIGFTSCKKDKDEDPKPVVDYTSSVVGTYVGQEIYYDINLTVTNTNNSKTLTVTKVGENKIQISSFQSGAAPYFTLSDAGNGNINVLPVSPIIGSAGGGLNIYVSSSKNLQVRFKIPIGTTSYFNGTKQ